MLPSTTTGPQHSSQFMNFHSAQCHSSTAVALNQFFIAMQLRATHATLVTLVTSVTPQQKKKQRQQPNATKS